MKSLWISFSSLLNLIITTISFLISICFPLWDPLFVSVRSILNFIWQDFVRFYVLIIFKREKCLFGTWANSILYRYVSKQPNIIPFQVNFLFVWLFRIIKSATSVGWTFNSKLNGTRWAQSGLPRKYLTTRLCVRDFRCLIFESHEMFLEFFYIKGYSTDISME